MSGGEEVLQMSHEVKATRNKDREKLVEDLKKTTGCFQIKFSVAVFCCREPGGIDDTVSQAADHEGINTCTDNILPLPQAIFPLM